MAANNEMYRPSYKELSLERVINFIANYCANHDIPNLIIKDAISNYNSCMSKFIIRGELRIGIIAYCIHMACKNNGIETDVHKIFMDFQISQKTIKKAAIMMERQIPVLKKN